MPDKRSYRRFSYENNIYLKFDKGVPIEGKLLDISFTGASVFLKENIDVDALVQTVVQFDSTSSVEQNLVGKGRVVQIKKQRLYAQDGYRVGIEFTEIDKGVVLNILDRLEAKIIGEIRKRDQAARKNPGLF